MSSTPKTKKSALPLKVIQRAISDGTRWRIFEALLTRGPMPTEYIARAVGASVTNVSKHLVFLRQVGLLEHQMQRIYAIPEFLRVPGERSLDFGPILIRFDRAES